MGLVCPCESLACFVLGGSAIQNHLDGAANIFGDVLVMIHSRGESRSVVEHVQLTRQAIWLGSTGPLRQLGEHRPDPPPKFDRRLVHQPASWLLDRGGHEGTAVETGLSELLGLGIEHGEDLLPRVVHGLDGRGKHVGRPGVTGLQIGLHQLFFADELLYNVALATPACSMMRSMPTLWMPSA
jgi:hypothetical protein